MKGGDSLEQLWSKRATAFREEISPYIRYVGQSGFLLFLSLIVISSAISYFKLIRDVPDSFPVTAAGTAALTLVLAWSPLRTWLAGADVVFLLPREGHMKLYLARSFRRSIWMTGLLAAAVLLIYMPIYRQGPGKAAIWEVIALAAVLRAANTFGAWRERQLTWPGMRHALRLGRWAAAAVVIAVLLSCPAWQSVLFTLLVLALFALLYKLPERHQMPWERLIAEESATRSRYYRFFSLFADVPTMPSKAYSRPYLAWIIRTIRYRHDNTFVYLYALSAIRTETTGILMRMLVLFGLVVYWLADAAWLDGWGQWRFMSCLCC
ncbi:ABC transporter permease [Paenibacillus protaetiae]|uniref:ABC transporter permease n=1 Tax=Paenibacillus protaetiae TaxID=2509456 RepID=A0A4P6EUJ3_9BACL|nr:ABC transporter permease [Paenibacillus protaetiae]QAY66614.1 ABC transporter permease [Paenibacillus protaetiae]